MLAGSDARAVDLLVRLLPASYPRLVAGWEQHAFGSDRWRETAVNDQARLGAPVPVSC